MIRIRYLLLGVAISFLGSCAEPTLELEQEDLFFSKLQIMKKKELPAEFQNVPQEIKEVLLGISGTKIGEGLLRRAAEALRNSGVTATFVYKLNLRREFRYQGDGRVEYNFVDMSTDEVLQLVFHELIHMVQEPKGELSYYLENEIEAYLGQYFYCGMANKEFKALRGRDRNFEKKIEELAKFFDIYTGKPTNESMFQNAFLIALGEIGLHPLYSSSLGWRMGPPPYAVCILSGLM